MNKIVRVLLIFTIVVLLFVAMDGFFILPEGKQAVITQFGKPVGKPKVDAGFHLKTPLL